MIRLFQPVPYYVWRISKAAMMANTLVQQQISMEWPVSNSIWTCWVCFRKQWNVFQKFISSNTFSIRHNHLQLLPYPTLMWDNLWNYSKMTLSSWIVQWMQIQFRLMNGLKMSKCQFRNCLKWTSSELSFFLSFHSTGWQCLIIRR